MNTGKMTCDNPYPCDFDRGIIQALAERFQPPGSLVGCATRKTTPPCKKDGADSCVYTTSPGEVSRPRGVVTRVSGTTVEPPHAPKPWQTIFRVF